MTRNLPSPKLLRQILRYEPETGKLFWLPRPREMFDTQNAFGTWNTRWANAEAFTQIDSGGYHHSRISKKSFKAHRVIWAMVYGSWPVDQIDHINGARDDNRLCNLRDVCRSENMQNTKKYSHNSSGHNGVSWQKSLGKWHAYIKLTGKKKHLGFHNCITSAVVARKLAEQGHGFTRRHGA